MYANTEMQAPLIVFFFSLDRCDTSSLWLSWRCQHVTEALFWFYCGGLVSFSSRVKDGVAALGSGGEGGLGSGGQVGGWVGGWGVMQMPRSKGNRYLRDRNTVVSSVVRSPPPTFRRAGGFFNSGLSQILHPSFTSCWKRKKMHLCQSLSTQLLKMTVECHFPGRQVPTLWPG